MANYTVVHGNDPVPGIRCHPDAGVLSDPPSLMFTWNIAQWWSLDPAGDYAADIELFGTPEILGTIGNLSGMLLVWLLMSTRDYKEYHANARGCFEWMLFYFLMHGAVHMFWGYKFRVPFTAGMNIAFLWMRHHNFNLSWQARASPEKSEKGRTISEAVAYMLVLFDLAVVSPRALTIQPLRPITVPFRPSSAF